MKCSKCNKEIRFSFYRSNELTAPNFSNKNWNLNFCDIKCRNEWEDSECGKNYDLKRLEKLDEYLEKCRNGYKWSGGEAEDGYFLKRPSDEVYNFEEQESLYIEEAKRIREKWNIKDSPQERERERQISQLRTEIQHLEQITNRTSEQERELQEKKQRLTELERDKQQEGNPKPTNWIPWIIGGIILVLVVGIIAYFWRKNKEK